MRFLKLGMLGVLGIVVVSIVLSLLIPSQVRISRAITIGADRDSVYQHIADVRNWKHWNAMTQNRDLTGKTYEVHSFKSDQLNVFVTPRDSVVFAEWQYKENDRISGGFLMLQPVADSTVVQWYFDFRLKWYPWEKFGSIIFDQQIGPPMERSLEALRELVTKKES